MPRFFFHLESGPDGPGAELPSILEAKAEAARYAGRLLLDGAETFWPAAELMIRVADEKGLTLFSLSVSGTDAPVIRVSPVIPA